MSWSRAQALAAGCNDFVAKPVHERELLATLGRALNLDWEYRETAAPFEPAPPRDTGAWPDRDDVIALTQLARGGDLDALRERVAAALARGAPGAAFFRQLDELATG